MDRNALIGRTRGSIISGWKEEEFCASERFCVNTQNHSKNYFI